MANGAYVGVILISDALSPHSSSLSLKFCCLRYDGGEKFVFCETGGAEWSENCVGAGAEYVDAGVVTVLEVSWTIGWL